MVSSVAAGAVSCAVPGPPPADRVLAVLVVAAAFRAGPLRLRDFLATTPRYPLRAKRRAAGHNGSPDVDRES